MILTIDQYLSNPQGKGSATLQMNLIKKEYDERYDKLIEKYGDFKYKVYQSRNGSFYIHFKIHSETYEKVEYDIVLRFDRTKESFQGSISNWSMKVVCNTPSFVFTYANVFRRNRLLIDELRNIIRKENYTKPPEVRNPYNQVGFEKTIYYACKFIKDSNLDKITDLKDIAISFSAREVSKELVSFDKIMAQIEREQKKISQDNKKKREAERKARNTILQRDEQKMTKVADRVQSRAKIVPRASRTSSASTRIKPIRKK